MGQLYLSNVFTDTRVQFQFKPKADLCALPVRVLRPARESTRHLPESELTVELVLVTGGFKMLF